MVAERVLVTGVNGFVGSALCRRLHSSGLLVRGAVRDRAKLPQRVPLGFHGSWVADTELQSFLDAGYNQQQALEVVLGISLATLCNFANSLAGTPVNPQLQQYLPGAV